jgi:DNA polymerase-4
MTAKQRKIIHIDMDAFFASVEQRDHPELQGKPVIVGGQPNSRGVVAACSYEARQFGIHSAMPCSRAVKLCPQALFVPPRFDAYKAVSKIIQTIFWRYASDVEPLSLDEAYLDVSHSTELEGSATRIAKAIKKDIETETQLIASAGVSYNKFLAKVASDMDKPDGLYVIRPEQGEAFIAALPIGDFYGVGPATETKMKRLGIKTGVDLRTKNRFELAKHFGKSADYFYQIARGIDNRPVRSTRIRKSLGKETTFKEDVYDKTVLFGQLVTLAERVFQQLDTQQFVAKTVTLKIKYANFKSITRSYSDTKGFIQLSHMPAIVTELLSRTDAGQQGIRLVGITTSNLLTANSIEQKEQLEMDYHK